VKVQGNQLVDATGKVIRLLGVNRSGSEYACVGSSSGNGWGFFDGPIDANAIAAIKSWYANAVRVPLNEDCWLGINLPSSNPYQGAAYQQAIVNFVQALNNAGMYVILDLHWSAPGTTVASSQQPMADADHSPAFWSSVATTFKNFPAVVFDLYNEPYVGDWNCWRNGCSVTTSAGTWTTAGMTQLVAAVRGAGATQPIMLGGLGYAGDLSQWLANAPADSLNPPQLVASFHTYCQGNTVAACQSSLADLQTNQWPTVATVANSVPVVTGEFGEYECATTYVNPYMTFADSHGISYLGWAWDPYGCGSFPALIVDYTGTPTAYGMGLKSHLASLNNPPPPSPTVAISSPTNNSTFAAGQPVAISVAASDPAGVTSITISGDGTQLATCNATTCSASWSPAPGTHTIQAVATDTGGRQGSASVTITVQSANPPTVTIMSPTNGVTYAVGQTVNISVSASDQVGVSSIVIDGDTTALATCNNTSSCTATWVPVQGTHTISATATGTDGQQASTSVSITVSSSAPPNPTVTITSPPNGSTYVNGGIPISATASDPAGISQIQIFEDQNLLKTCNNVTSCSTTWQAKRSARGQHTITVTATDPGGRQGSASVTITVATHNG
jgi:hypothetical protein